MPKDRASDDRAREGTNSPFSLQPVSASKMKFSVLFPPAQTFAAQLLVAS